MRTQKNKPNTISGFTLLEMLVVMIILSVLVGVGLRSFLTSQMRSRDARKKSDLEQLARALELYYSDKGHYPVHTLEGKMRVYWLNNDEEAETVFEWGEPFFDPANRSTIYMAKLPSVSRGQGYFYLSYVKDRLSEHGFSQASDSDKKAQAYRAYTSLENFKDESLIPVGQEINIPCSVQTSGVCNYVVSSPNLHGELGHVLSSPLGGLPEPSPTEGFGFSECNCLGKAPDCPGSVAVCQQYMGGSCGWECANDDRL